MKVSSSATPLSTHHPVFAAHERTACIEFSEMSFVKEVSRARTFGFLADFEKLQKLSLAQGESLDNSVVVDESKKYSMSTDFVPTTNSSSTRSLMRLAICICWAIALLDTFVGISRATALITSWSKHCWRIPMHLRSSLSMSHVRCRRPTRETRRSLRPRF